MYCSNCGKQNPEDSKFCKICGLEIVKASVENKTVNNSQDEVTISVTKNRNTLQNNKKIGAGIDLWLGLVGLGLIIGFLRQGYAIFEYLPLISATYNIPGYLTLLRLEFLVMIIYVIANGYLFYLYFKRHKNFPKYYVIFLIFTVFYVTIDHFLLASLVAPTPEQQKIITDTLSQNSGEVAKSIFFGIIWVSYMINSKRVEATFITS